MQWTAWKGCRDMTLDAKKLRSGAPVLPRTICWAPVNEEKHSFFAKCTAASETNPKLRNGNASAVSQQRKED